MGGGRRPVLTAPPCETSHGRGCFVFRPRDSRRSRPEADGARGATTARVSARESGPHHLSPTIEVSHAYLNDEYAARGRRSSRAPGDSAATARAAAQETTTVVKTARGGLLATTPQHQFEVFFYPTGVRVFPQTDGRAARSTPRGRPGPRRSTTRTRPGRGSPGRSAARRARRARSTSPSASATPRRSGAKVTFEVSGLADASRIPGHLHRPPRIRARSRPPSRPAPRGGVAAVPRYIYAPRLLWLRLLSLQQPHRRLSPRRVPTTAIAARAGTSAATGTPSGPATAIGPPGGTCRSPSRG